MEEKQTNKQTQPGSRVLPMILHLLSTGHVQALIIHSIEIYGKQEFIFDAYSNKSVSCHCSS